MKVFFFLQREGDWGKEREWKWEWEGMEGKELTGKWEEGYGSRKREENGGGAGQRQREGGYTYIHTYIHSYIGMSLRFTFNPYRVPIRERRLFFFFSLIKEL